MHNVRGENPVENSADLLGGEASLPFMSAAGGPAVGGASSTGALAKGACLRGYRILSLIGRGGMGLVYAAQQQYPKRVVALKVIHPTLTDVQHFRRFTREAEVLARLEHPGIAHLYEAGMEETGAGPQPFLAMEFIQGVPITVFVQKTSQPSEDRLKLFMRVCDAVHFAHQQGVVHRDLKPANILVNAQGQPKILDFGVARIIGGDLAQMTRHTEVGQLVGTLAYMSPEQAAGAGDHVDARSDVYALGVILYEMLTGRMPYAIGKRSLPDAVRMIQDEDPTKLSSIHRSFGGDIENIVNKALEKDRQRRYATAEELARDLGRYLANEPIHARKPSTAYQVWKFSRRHRAVVAGALAVFVALSAGLVGTTWQAVRARQEKGMADVNALRADHETNIARAAQALADRRAHEAGVRLAEVLVSQGNSFISTNRIEDARRAYLDAWNTFEQLGMSPVAAKIGVWEADRRRSLPLCSVIVRADQFVGPGLFDGDRTFMVADNQNIGFWDAVTGSRLRTLPSHNGVEHALDISQDGRLLVSGTNGGTIEVWDIMTGSVLCAIHTQDRYVSSVHLTRDGMSIISAGEFLHVWNARSGELIRNFAGSRRSFTCMAVSPDGRNAVTGAVRADAALWDLSGVREPRKLEGHIGEIKGVSWFPDGKRVATLAEDGLRLWDGATGAPLAILNFSSPPTKMAFSADGTLVACSLSNGIICVKDLASHQTVTEFFYKGQEPSSLAFSPDGRLLLSTSSGGSWELWSVRHSLRGTVAAQLGKIHCVAYSKEGGMLAAGDDNGTITLWDAASMQVMQTIRGINGPIHALAFCADGTRLIAGGNGVIRLWDLRSGRLLRAFTGHSAPVSALCLSPDDTILFSCDTQGELRRWNVDSGKSTVLLHQNEGMQSMCLSADASTLFCGCDSHVYRVQHPLGVPAIGVFVPEGDGDSALALSPDGQMLAGGGGDGVIRLWDVKSATVINTLTGHGPDIRGLAFVNDALVSTGVDGTLRLWSTTDCRESGMFTPAQAANLCLAVNPQGDAIAVGNERGELRAWDLTVAEAERTHGTLVDSTEHNMGGVMDPAEMAALAVWYSQHGMDSFAVELFEKARAQGIAVSPLALARCCWKSEAFEKAAVEFSKARGAREAPDAYLEMCWNAVTALAKRRAEFAAGRAPVSRND